MKQCKRCGEVKPLEAFGKNKRAKDGLNYCCRECDAYRAKCWYEANKERGQAAAKKRYETNPERELARAKAWREANKKRYQTQKKAYHEANLDRERETRKAWYEANREEMQARSRAYYENNRPRVYAHCRARKAGLATATPMWADRGAIAAIYAEAERLTRETGIPHHVDHIIPLKGKGVCGLHVPWNLCAIPAAENLSKSNRIPDHLIV